jgi:hypothetical protein
MAKCKPRYKARSKWKNEAERLEAIENMKRGGAFPVGLFDPDAKIYERIDDEEKEEKENA